jgi:hypothetical protein
MLFCLLVLGACGIAQPDENEEQAFPELDRCFFDRRVQPILSRSCAFPACHGSSDRYYRLYARNRLRINTEATLLGATMTEKERKANFEATLAVVDVDRKDASLLLTKPMDVAEPTGQFHRGKTLYGGGDVFLSQDERDFKVLKQWIEGATETQDCTEPGSDL